MDHEEVVKRNQAHTLASWTEQNQWNPPQHVKGRGRT
jgi:hypothetical protein